MTNTLRPLQDCGAGPIVNKHRHDIRRLAQHFGLTNIRVFGSTIHGEDHEGSDLDLLVNAPKGATLLDLTGLQQSIEDEYGISVDVVTEKDLPTQFRKKVTEEAQKL